MSDGRKELPYGYVIASLVFAFVVTIGVAVAFKPNPLLYLAFLSYVPYAVTVIIRINERRRKQ